MRRSIHQRSRVPMWLIGRLGLLLVMALPALFARAQTVSTNVTAATLLDSANRSANEAKYDAAIQQFSDFLKLYPTNANVSQARIGLSTAQAAKLLDAANRSANEAKYDAAIQQFTEFLKLYPSNACVSQAKTGLDTASAAKLLDSAHRSFNEARHDAAIQQFNDFLKLYPSNACVSQASFGLGLTLIEGPRRDWQGGLKALQTVTGQTNAADRPMALYLAGRAQRALGETALGQMAGKPAPEAAQISATATQRFTEAAGSFMAAADALALQPTQAEWAARSYCEAADLQLRLGKWNAAAQAAGAVLDDAALKAGRYFSLATYHLGCAQFNLKDYRTAGRTLSKLAPFEQEYGLHARYLLGRVHHLQGAPVEASIQYNAALADYDKRKKQDPNTLPPDKRAAWEALTRGPMPDYLAYAGFYLALCACETDSFGPAADGFAAFIQQNPKSPLLPEAQLRLGFCRMQLNSYADAVPALQAVTNQPAVADRALWWLGRCQIKLADPKNPQTYNKLLRDGFANLHQAAELAAKAAPADPDAKTRRSEILMDLADNQMSLKQHREAIDACRAVIQDNADPTRVEEAMQRCVTALHLTGAYRESDDLAAQFEQRFPRSALLHDVLLRRAENALMTAAGEASSTPQGPAFAGMMKYYQRVVDAYPDSPSANLAREGLAGCLYRLGQYEDALAVLKTIPEDGRSGDLANVPYLMADCLIHTTPETQSDALSAALTVAKAEQAVKLLESFIGANPQHPRLADALLKLGWCYSRLADNTISAEERSKANTAGLAAYNRLITTFPKDSQTALAVLGRANCLLALAPEVKDGNQRQKSMNDAMSDLGNFLYDSRETPSPPQALVQLSGVLNPQDAAAAASDAAKTSLAQFEASLRKDTAALDKAMQFKLQQAQFLRQAGDTARARAVLEGLAKDYSTHPMAAQAVCTSTRYVRDDLAAQLLAAQQLVLQSRDKPDDLPAAQRSLANLIGDLRDKLKKTLAQAETLAMTAAGSPIHCAALYEAASIARLLTDVDRDDAMRQKAQEAVARMRARMPPPAEKPGQPPPPPPPLREPPVSLSDIAPPPSERTAIECWEKVVSAAPDTPLADQARVDLADILIDRSSFDAALQRAGEVVNRKPPPEILQQARLQLAEAWLGLKDPTAALARAALTQADIIAADTTSPLMPFARYLAGEACAQMKNYPAALERLQPFTDWNNVPFRNVPNVTERAYLALARCYLETTQWDACQRIPNWLRERFPRSPFMEEAQYLAAVSAQMQENYDAAAGAHAALAGQTPSSLGAQAQLQIALCRITQQRFPEATQWLRSVATNYDLPEWRTLDGFAVFRRQNDRPPLLADAELSRNFYSIAATNFTDTPARTPTNAAPTEDRALWWIGRCQMASVTPRNAKVFGPVMQAAIANLRRAAAFNAGSSDPDAATRRADILMDLAGALAATKQYKDAADTYQQALACVGRPRTPSSAPRNETKPSSQGKAPGSAKASGSTLKTVIENLRRIANADATPSVPNTAAGRADSRKDFGGGLAATNPLKEAADTYLSAAPYSSGRAEDAAMRRIAALTEGGLTREADDACAQFEKDYPGSLMLQAILFNQAETTYRAALNTVTNVAAAGEPSQLFAEALARYQRLTSKFPVLIDMTSVRLALGTCLYQAGKYDDAIATLGAIPPEIRKGDLGEVLYMLADSLIRTVQARQEDKAWAAEAASRLARAQRLFEQYFAANERSQNPRVPEALFRIGWCQARAAETAADPEQKRYALGAARGTFDRLLQQFPTYPSMPAVMIERANCSLALGEQANAVQDLNRFLLLRNSRGSTVAPSAIMQLAGILRSQNRSAEAADAVGRYLAQLETELLKTPSQADKVPLLRYEQIVSLKMAGRSARARALCDSLARDFPTSPAAYDAAWRAAQLASDTMTNTAYYAAWNAINRRDIPAADLAVARDNLDDSAEDLRSMHSEAAARADSLARTTPGTPLHCIALYETALAGRLLANIDNEAAAQKRRLDLVARMRERLPQKPLQPGQQPPPGVDIREPAIPLTDLPESPSERAAVDAYAKLIAAAPDKTIAVQARLELADMQMRRLRYDAALQLAGDALNANPPPELLASVRLRLAAACLGPDEARPAVVQLALAQAGMCAGDSDRTVSASALYLTAKALARQKDWPKVIEKARPFMDDGWYSQNVPDLTGPALMLLGRAYMEAGQLDPSRQAWSRLLEWLPRSALFDEAVYSIGLVLEKQGQRDPAVDTYRRIAGVSTSEFAARAQLQIGLCRSAQNRFPEALEPLLLAATLYEAPDLQAQACFEAAQIQQKLKKPDEAAKLLQKVVADFANSPWAQKAKDKLNELSAAQ